MFRQSKLSCVAELENTKTVLFKSLRDRLQVTNMGTQLRRESELFDWYRESQTVLYRRFLIDLQQLTNERLLYSTNNASNASIFHTANDS